MKQVLHIIFILSMIPVSLVSMIWGWGLEPVNWGWITLGYVWLIMTSCIAEFLKKG